MRSREIILYRLWGLTLRFLPKLRMLSSRNCWVLQVSKIRSPSSPLCTCEIRAFTTYPIQNTPEQHGAVQVRCNFTLSWISEAVIQGAAWGDFLHICPNFNILRTSIIWILNWCHDDGRNTTHYCVITFCIGFLMWALDAFLQKNPKFTIWDCNHMACQCEILSTHEVFHATVSLFFA